MICGGSIGYEDYNKLYLTNLNEGTGDHLRAIFNKGVCVKECPKDKDVKIDCMPTKEVADCDGNQVTENQYASIDVLGYCFPEGLENLPKES